MILSAGPTAGSDSCHAVLWTKRSFSGDVKIEFEYTRADTKTSRSISFISSLPAKGIPHIPKISRNGMIYEESLQ